MQESVVRIFTHGQVQYASNKPPVTLGHEFSGIVEEVGSDVKELKVGDRVTSETTFKTCGKCIYCKNEEYNLCSSRQGLGTQADGGFAEYVINHEARKSINFRKK